MWETIYAFEGLNIVPLEMWYYQDQLDVSIFLNHGFVYNCRGSIRISMKFVANHNNTFMGMAAMTDPLLSAGAHFTNMDK